MQLSPLILKTYWVTNISVKAAVPSFSSPQEAAQMLAAAKTDFSTKVQVAKSNEDPCIWKVTLQLGCRPSENSSICPYVVDAELVGFFEVDKSVDESKIDDLVACNGHAVLLGAARELILLITGRGPLPPFTIPSATFVDMCPSNRKKIDEKTRPDQFGHPR